MNTNTHITLRSHHGRFVVAEPNTQVLANRDQPGEWESFLIQSPFNKPNLQYGDKISLRTAHHKYVCAESNLTVVGNRDQPGEWEQFVLVDPFNPYNNQPIYPGSQVALRTAHGRFLCAESDGRLVGDRTQVGEWERFVINVTGGGHHHGHHGHGHHHGGHVINYGDQIKIKHIQTGNVLHSHSINYTGGSRQQQVTCFHQRDNNDFFKVVGFNGYESGPVPYGVPVNIVHVATGQHLHSHHGIASPTTGQQEVTCFGGKDNNNHWVFLPSGHNNGSLEGGAKINIRHVATNARLHSHNLKFRLTGHSNDEQQEVTCFSGTPDSNDDWKISEISGRFHQE